MNDYIGHRHLRAFTGLGSNTFQSETLSMACNVTQLESNLFADGHVLRVMGSLELIACVI
jgi:hypothetical protein